MHHLLPWRKSWKIAERKTQKMKILKASYICMRSGWLHVLHMESLTNSPLGITRSGLFLRERKISDSSSNASVGKSCIRENSTQWWKDTGSLHCMSIVSLIVILPWNCCRIGLVRWGCVPMEWVEGARRWNVPSNWGVSLQSSCSPKWPLRKEKSEAGVWRLCKCTQKQMIKEHPLKLSYQKENCSLLVHKSIEM